MDERLSGTAETLLYEKQLKYKKFHNRYFDAVDEYDSARKLFWLGIALIILGAAIFYSINRLSYYYFLFAGIIQTVITIPCIGGLKKISILQNELNLLKTDIESDGLRICCVDANSKHHLEFYHNDSIPYGAIVLKPHTPIDFNEYQTIFK